MKKIKRLHDNLYLEENRYKKPKESAKIIINLIKKNFFQCINQAN